ncbi:ABC transporter permease [Nocardiopsis changdeensis]|uniref:ABC transporter permease n=1 Tax=Nocardiopsis changdeensis TaxID=2831969 RepID=A0ABX8BNJ4_9ACTN|nr:MULTISPECIES: ABC transporter permease [Nocardiopsis]QUX22446.1 ABC transporter permease [Nocardiopsis changdeensis]QYX38388.1 ABC transporter permease [Nocardiopsis sp. MT53]
MRSVGILGAELRKAASLPATGVAVLVALLGSALITLLNALSARSGTEGLTSPFEVGYAAVPLGTVGAVVLGVVVVSSEYTSNSPDAGGGRQITATLAAVPSRVRLLLAKALTVVLAVAATAAVTIPASVGVARLVIGGDAAETVTPEEMLHRFLGATLYWVLTGLIAFAITVLTRSGVVPLIVLIVNSSLVSFSLLLTRLTPLAHWLPDMAGRRLFGGLGTVEGGLDAVPGALVMAAWTLGLLVVAAAVFSRRDA